MIQAKTVFLVLIAAAALGAGVWLGGMLFTPTETKPVEIAGIYLPDSKPIESFTLTQQSGRPFTREDFKGRWTFLYFGYTYCPDVCPMTLLELNKLANQLAAQGVDRDTGFMMISVDPERDTPARLGEYTAHFNPKFTGATGAPEELARLTEQLGVAYFVPDHEPGENYTVDHSSTVVLINPDGRLQAVFTPPHQPDVMAADFVKIRDRYRNARPGG